MSGCKNCGACEKPERCECCGACKHCGKVHAMPAPAYVPYPQPVYIPSPLTQRPWWLDGVTITCTQATNSLRVDSDHVGVASNAGVYPLTVRN